MGVYKESRLREHAILQSVSQALRNRSRPAGIGGRDQPVDFTKWGTRRRVRFLGRRD